MWASTTMSSLPGPSTTCSPPWPANCHGLSVTTAGTLWTALTQKPSMALSSAMEHLTPSTKSLRQQSTMSKFEIQNYLLDSDLSKSWHVVRYLLFILWLPGFSKEHMNIVYRMPWWMNSSNTDNFPRDTLHADFGCSDATFSNYKD